MQFFVGTFKATTKVTTKNNFLKKPKKKQKKFNKKKTYFLIEKKNIKITGVNTYIFKI